MAFAFFSQDKVRKRAELWRRFWVWKTGKSAKSAPKRNEGAFWDA